MALQTSEQMVISKLGKKKPKERKKSDMIDDA